MVKLAFKPTTGKNLYNPRGTNKGKVVPCVPEEAKCGCQGGVSSSYSVALTGVTSGLPISSCTTSQCQQLYEGTFILPQVGECTWSLEFEVQCTNAFPPPDDVPVWARYVLEIQDDGGGNTAVSLNVYQRAFELFNPFELVMNFTYLHSGRADCLSFSNLPLVKGPDAGDGICGWGAVTASLTSL